VTIAADDMRRFLMLFATNVADQREELTRLDSAIGDGDHGINMDRGMKAVLEALPGIEGGGAGTLLKQAGMRLISTVGGASGPLYGTFFLRMGTTLGDAADVSREQFVAALRAGLDGVAARGKAQLDDKTMVDAMAPAVEALESSTDGSGWSEALSRAADAATAGRDRVTPLVARKGRASYLGERSAGHQDPGATSAALLFATLRDTFTDQA
jgi:phosphoenolpyruvate---glycerone phosphotransferase subunit DhaL